MSRPGVQFDPYLHDPDHWGVSLAQMAELMIPCLDAIGARTVAEVGAFAGDLTRVLVSWAAENGGEVVAIDPAPQSSLVSLEQESGALKLVREPSLTAIPKLSPPDAIVLDGDHNYFTVSEELRLIYERAAEKLPLILLHDVCWPHARRDDYFDAELIPEAYRHEVISDAGGIVPGEDGPRPGGLPYPRSARHEGGPRNGVLTAVEDFVAEHDELRLVVVPAFFGFGAVWNLSSTWSEQLAAILDPWDRNPILERLEENRVHQLAERFVRTSEVWRLRDQLAEQQSVLRRLLESSAFSVAERLSTVRVKAGVAPAQTAVSKDEIRRVLGEQ
jgi:hypothetical protein